MSVRIHSCPSCECGDHKPLTRSHCRRACPHAVAESRDRCGKAQGHDDGLCVSYDAEGTPRYTWATT